MVYYNVQKYASPYLARFLSTPNVQSMLSRSLKVVARLGLVSAKSDVEFHHRMSVQVGF